MVLPGNNGGIMEASEMLRDVRGLREIAQKFMQRLDALEAEILRPPVAVFVEGAVCTPTASVDVLRLPARSARILREMGIRTIGELVTLSDYDILMQKGAGKSTLWDIKGCLEGVGYKLKTHPALNSLGIHPWALENLRRYGIDSTEKLLKVSAAELRWSRAFKHGQISGIEDALQKRGLALRDDPHPLESFGFSFRVQRLLWINKINTLEDLLSRRIDNIRDLGTKSLANIEEKLALRGFAFKNKK